MAATEMAVPTFSTWDVCKLVGCSYRQADWWARTAGRVEGHGSGTVRRWTPDDVLALAASLMVDSHRHEVVAAVLDACAAGRPPGFVILTARGAWATDDEREVVAELMASGESTSVLCLRPVHDRLYA